MTRKLLALAMLLGMLSFAVPAYAVDPFQDACELSDQNSAACQGRSSEDPVSGQNGILYKATRLLSIIAGVAAIILIVVSAIFFITANGDASNIASARNTLIGAIVGLVIVVCAQAILNFVLTKV